MPLQTGLCREIQVTYDHKQCHAQKQQDLVETLRITPAHTPFAEHTKINFSPKPFDSVGTEIMAWFDACFGIFDLLIVIGYDRSISLGLVEWHIYSGKVTDIVLLERVHKSGHCDGGIGSSTQC